MYVGVDLLGDGLVKLPFLRALRRCYPQARVTWLAGKGGTVFAHELAPAVEGLVDEVIEAAGIGSRWVELASRPLPGRDFDLILDTQRRLLTSMIVRRIRHRRFVSAAADWLFSDVKGPREKPQRVRDQVLQLLSVAYHGPAGGPLDTSGGVSLPATLREVAARLLPEGQRRVLLAPGAGGREKCWPLPRFAALARELATAGADVGFLLGPSELDWSPDISAEVPGARFLLDEMPWRGPLATMALAEHADVCVANDAGWAHLFAAVGAPLIVLFGPTSPTKHAPEARPLRILRAQDFGGDEMAAIPTAAVRDAVLEMLVPRAGNGAGAGSPA